MSLLKSRGLRWIAIALLLLALAAYAALHVLMPAHPSPQQISEQMRAQARLTGPAKLYAATCAHCHDARIAPLLRGRGLSPEAIKAIVRNGVGAMPPFVPGRISDTQLAEVADYVSQLPAEGAKP